MKKLTDSQIHKILFLDKVYVKNNAKWCFLRWIAISILGYLIASYFHLSIILITVCTFLWILGIMQFFVNSYGIRVILGRRIERKISNHYKNYISRIRIPKEYLN